MGACEITIIKNNRIMAAANPIAFCSRFRQLQLLTILLLLLSGQTQASGINIVSASTYNNEGSYQLNADIRYELSDEVLEALNNGIAITLKLTIKVKRPRPYWWDETITTLFQRYTLRYHALSGQYIVQFLNSEEQRSYLSLSSALRTIGQIRELVILDNEIIKISKNMTVQLHSELDTNALPAPLRPAAWLSSGWKLSSEWYTCPLQS